MYYKVVFIGFINWYYGIYNVNLAGKADQLTLTQVANRHCILLTCTQGFTSPSNPSDNVTELNEQVNKIMLDRIR